MFTRHLFLYKSWNLTVTFSVTQLLISQLFQQCLFFAILSIYIIFDGEITISTEKVLWINNEGNWFFIGKSLWKSDTAFHFFGTNREFSSRVVKKRPMYVELTQVLLFQLRLLATTEQAGDSPTSNLRNRMNRVTQFLGISFLN